jgi:hypothetical protein
MAIEGGANCREFGELNVPPTGLDPVIGQARHTEDAGRRFLGEPQSAAAAAQRGSNTGLHILCESGWLLLLWTRTEQPGAYGSARPRGF